MVHYLKTWPEYFGAIKAGRKTFEFRFNDRDFQVGDKLVLQEYDPKNGRFSGHEVRVTVTYTLSDFPGLEDGFIVLGFKKGTAAKTTSFTPPTPKEAEEYFTSIDSTVQRAHDFIDYYQSVGWKVGGRAQMTDWKAAARRFTRNNFNQPKTKQIVNGSIHQFI